jgi:DNA-binding transcriptional MerR regulator
VRFRVRGRVRGRQLQVLGGDHGVAGAAGRRAKSGAVETYTLSEAAERCGVSVAALRRRADRGTIRTVKRDGVRRVPRSELERAGLGVAAPATPAEVVRELAETIRRQERELAALRALPERVDAERERVAAAEHRAADSAAEALRLRAELDAIAAAGPIRALRLRQRLRRGAESAPNGLGEAGANLGGAELGRGA